MILSPLTRRLHPLIKTLADASTEPESLSSCLRSIILLLTPRRAKRCYHRQEGESYLLLFGRMILSEAPFIPCNRFFITLLCWPSCRSNLLFRTMFMARSRVSFRTFQAAYIITIVTGLGVGEIVFGRLSVSALVVHGH